MVVQTVGNGLVGRGTAGVSNATIATEVLSLWVVRHAGKRSPGYLSAPQPGTGCWRTWADLATSRSMIFMYSRPEDFRDDCARCADPCGVSLVVVVKDVSCFETARARSSQQGLPVR
jgi:hypothetical protein